MSLWGSTPTSPRIQDGPMETRPRCPPADQDARTAYPAVHRYPPPSAPSAPPRLSFSRARAVGLPPETCPAAFAGGHVDEHVRGRALLRGRGVPRSAPRPLRRWRLGRGGGPPHLRCGRRRRGRGQGSGGAAGAAGEGPGQVPGAADPAGRGAGGPAVGPARRRAGARPRALRRLGRSRSRSRAGGRGRAAGVARQALPRGVPLLQDARAQARQKFLPARRERPRALRRAAGEVERRRGGAERRRAAEPLAGALRAAAVALRAGARALRPPLHRLERGRVARLRPRRRLQDAPARRRSDARGRRGLRRGAAHAAGPGRRAALRLLRVGRGPPRGLGRRGAGRRRRRGRGRGRGRRRSAPRRRRL